MLTCPRSLCGVPAPPHQGQQEAGEAAGLSPRTSSGEGLQLAAGAREATGSPRGRGHHQSWGTDPRGPARASCRLRTRVLGRLLMPSVPTSGSGCGHLPTPGLLLLGPALAGQLDPEDRLAEGQMRAGHCHARVAGGVWQASCECGARSGADCSGTSAAPPGFCPTTFHGFPRRDCVPRAGHPAGLSPAASCLSHQKSVFSWGLPVFGQ